MPYIRRRYGKNPRQGIDPDDIFNLSLALFFRRGKFATIANRKKLRSLMIKIARMRIFDRHRRESAQRRLAAHTLQGALRVFRADDARDVAMQLETKGANGELQGAGDLLRTLARKLDRLTQSISVFAAAGENHPAQGCSEPTKLKGHAD